ncbi:conserved Plasmodium protein, unknown function [Plasmodium reichenowi]|uniref:Uncharacterized protein n=1 Tax=Plasmodium reichenowi TaxID=5854 RepID=A0A2P9DRA2_PLARE|nr:conserved Plasmodium protein, unknown function [Plasmodium reichenowi]
MGVYFSEVKGYIYDDIKGNDIYDDIKRSDIYDDIKGNDMYDDIKRSDIYDNIKNNNENIHVGIYDGQKKRHVEKRKHQMKCRDEENILYDSKVEEENYNDTIVGEESNHNMKIEKEDIPLKGSIKKSKILYKECIPHEENEIKNVRNENNIVDKIVVKLSDRTCTYEEDDYINNMTIKKKENIEEGIKLLSNLKDDVVIGCVENKEDKEKIKISQCNYDKMRVRYNECKYNGYVKDGDKYNDSNNNDSNIHIHSNNVKSFLYDNSTDTCAASTFSALINKDRIYHYDKPDSYNHINFVESEKKLEPKKETITFSFRDKYYEELKDVDPRCSTFFQNDKDEYTNYMLIKDEHIKDHVLKEKKEKSSVLCKGYDLYGNKSVERLYNNKCINKNIKGKMKDNKIKKIKGISCDKNIYSIHNRIRKKEEDICVKDGMQNGKKIKEKNKIHIKLQDVFDMKTCKNNDMFTCPMKKEKPIDAYKNYGNILYTWILNKKNFNYPTAIKGKDKKVYNIDDVEKKSLQRIYESKLSEKSKEEKKNGSLNNRTDIKNKKGILKNKSIVYKDNKTMNGFNLRDNLLNILDTSKLYPKCELICRIKKS